MPSPFPGMDPYLEDPLEWPGVRHGLLAAISHELNRQIVPGLIARICEQVYVVSAAELTRRTSTPIHGPVARTRLGDQPALGPTISPALAIHPYSGDEMVRDRYIEIQEARSRAVVTTIELLSSESKLLHSTNRDQFLARRQAIFVSQTHWLEIDLLRAGERPADIVLGSDYYAMLRPGDGDGAYAIWSTNLHDRLPTIIVPLRSPYPDVLLDVQAAFDEVYERAYYSMPDPPLKLSDANWVAARVRDWQQARSLETDSSPSLHSGSA